MKRIGFVLFLFIIGIYCFAETWGELNSRVQLVHNRTIELQRQSDTITIDNDRVLLLGRIASAAKWLSKRYDELINHFNTFLSKKQLDDYIMFADYWNGVSDYLNNWAYDQEIERLNNLANTGVDNPKVTELLRAFSTGQLRTNIELNNGGSRP
jgi:hypothetical protein